MAIVFTCFWAAWIFWVTTGEAFAPTGVVIV